jgi:hypothetical protein
MPNPNHPRLCIRILIVQSIDCNPGRFRHFKGSGFNVDRDHLPMIAFLDLSAYCCLIECIATLGKFFFAISGLSDCHEFDLATTSLLHASLEARSMASAVSVSTARLSGCK